MRIANAERNEKRRETVEMKGDLCDDILVHDFSSNDGYDLLGTIVDSKSERFGSWVRPNEAR
jgi:hypothetical protein